MARLRIAARIASPALLAVVGCAGDERGVGDRESDVRAVDGRYISWVEHRIDDSALASLRLRGADGLELADLDADGREDVVAVHEDSSHVRLSFATDDPDRWRSVTLASGVPVSGVEDAAVADLDGDGDPDLVVACEDGHLAYFDNPGGSRARTPSAWQRGIPTRTRDRGSWIRVYAADLDEDPALEVIATNKSIPMPGGYGSMDVPRTPVSIFDPDGSPLDLEGWRETRLGEYVVPVNARPVDLDGDGDLDVVAGSRGEARLVVHERVDEGHAEGYSDGKGETGGWRARPVSLANPLRLPLPRLPKRLSGFALAIADLDGDGRLDLVANDTPWSVVWLAQPRRLDEPWRAHRIASTPPDSPNALTLVDVNGDGRLDLFSGGYSQDPRETETVEPGLLHRAGGLFWFEQPADPRDDWIRHDVSRRVRAMYDVFVPRDLNGDGLVDLIGTRGNSGALDGVFWLEQRRTERPVTVFRTAWSEDSRQLPPLFP